MIYIDKDVIYTTETHGVADFLGETVGKPVILCEGVEDLRYQRSVKLSQEERLIQYSKIALGLIGLALLAWKL